MAIKILGIDLDKTVCSPGGPGDAEAVAFCKLFQRHLLLGTPPGIQGGFVLTQAINRANFL